jgi:hypothetical protein
MGYRRTMTPENRLHRADQFTHPSRTQRLPAEQWTNATDGQVVYGRNGSPAPEQQGNDAQAFAIRIDSKRSELQVERFGHCVQKEPVMVTRDPNALADLSLICLLIVYFM